MILLLTDNVFTQTLSTMYTKASLTRCTNTLNTRYAVKVARFSFWPPPRGPQQGPPQGRRVLSFAGDGLLDGDARGVSAPPQPLPTARKRARASTIPGTCTTTPPTSHNHPVLNL